MKKFLRRRLMAGVLTALTGSTIAARQGPAPNNAAQVHIQAARNVAGSEHTGVFNVTCGQLTPAPRSSSPAAPRQPGPPPRESWHVEPAKVFDNLYFLGQSEYSSWAVTTSQGIIVIDTIFDYSVEDEVVGGMKKLGLDPAQIKYAIVSHGHGDHSGGRQVSAGQVRDAHRPVSRGLGSARAHAEQPERATGAQTRHRGH